MAEQPAAATAASSSIATSNEKSDEKISTNKVHHFPQASNPYSSWDSMWSQMTREGGWIEAKFDSDNKSYFIHPHIKNNVLGLVGSNNDWSFMEGEELEMVSNYTEGLHYFNSLQSLQKYAKEHLGWVGDGSSTDMEVEDSNNETVEKINALDHGARTLLFKAVYFGGVHQTADIRLASLRRYFGEGGMDERLDDPGGSILEKSGLISIRNNPIDTTYRIKVQLRDMEDAIGKDFYKKGFYKFILDRINRSYENKTRPLQQQKKSANGMNNRKQPTNRNRNELINQEKDNTSSLQQTTANTSNENGTAIERRSSNSMSNATNTSASTAVATDSSPVSNAATAAAKRVSLSPDTTKKDPPIKRSSRVSKGNDDQVDKKMTPVDQDKVYENKTCDIWDNYLKKERGWEYGNGELGADWAFYPGRLLKKYTKGVIKKKGIRGIHWANGWKELGEMLMTYGCHHAPQSLDDVGEKLGEKVSLEYIIDKLFVDEKVGGKKKSGSSTSSAASTTTVTAKSKAATREHDGTDPSGGDTTSSSSASSQAKAGTSGQAGLKRKAVEADDKRKKKQKKESNPSGNERKKESSKPSGSSASNVVSTTVAAPVAATKSNNQDRAADKQPGVSSNTKKKDKKKSSSSKLTPNMKRYLNGISFQHYDGMSKEIEKNKQEIEKYKARELDMSKAVDDSKKETEELKACLCSKDASINTLRKENEKLEGNATSRNGFISRLQGKIDTQKKEIITLKNEGIEKSTEMKTLRNEKNKLEEQVKRKDLEIKALMRRMVSDERKHDANQAQKQRHDALAQSVSSEAGEEDDEDKKVMQRIKASIESKVLADSEEIEKASMDDIVGNASAKAVLLDLLLKHDPKYKPFYEEDKDTDTTAILLYGPAGTGKTLFARALAAQKDYIFILVSTDDILDEYIGKSDKKIRAYFTYAKEKATESGKSVVLCFDEADRLFHKPGSNDCGVTSGITGILQQELSGAKESSDKVVVVATTNFLHKLPSPVRSRFQEIEIKLPNLEERVEILKLEIARQTTSALRSDLKESDLTRISEKMDGKSGRDIKLLVKSARSYRRSSAMSHNGYWGKDTDGIYYPCYHTREACSAETLSYDDILGRGLKAMPPPLSVKHFDEVSLKSMQLENEDENEE